jgi:molecular chaperone DnaK
MESYGIDFGTTNTRVAYFNGEEIRILPFEDEKGSTVYHIPSIVGYKNGEATAFGYEALRKNDLSICKSIKWLLDKDDPVDIGGFILEPAQVAFDFFAFLKEAIEKLGFPEEYLSNTSLTIPVNFTYAARERLIYALKKAGIGIQHVFHEPIAALYCDARSRQMPGTSAVFDWGGGTLDIAVVRLNESWAQVLAFDGLKVGGDDFDRLIIEKALADFALKYPGLPVTSQQILTARGTELKLIAEKAKKSLSTSKEKNITRADLLPSYTLDFLVKREDFEAWTESYINQAIACLEGVIYNAGITNPVLTHLLVSGGTCHIPAIQTRIKQEFGVSRVVSTLRASGKGEAERDIANATAMGAALLCAFGGQPVFTRDIGIRMADATSEEDLFYPVYRTGEVIEFDKTLRESFFITDPGMGVARLLICDRLGGNLRQRGGSLKRIITVPVDKNESHLEVIFSIDRGLVLNIKASGRIARCSDKEGSCKITDLAVGFKIPPYELKEGVKYAV